MLAACGQFHTAALRTSIIILHRVERVKTFFEAREGIFFAEEREDFGRAAWRDFLSSSCDADDPHHESFLDARGLDVRFEFRIEAVVRPFALRDGFEQLDDGGQQVFGLFRRDLVALVDVELGVEGRLLAEEADFVWNLAEALDARAQELGEAVPVCREVVRQVASERLRHLGEFRGLHRLEVFAADPAELLVVKDGRGFREAFEAEMLDEFLHREDFLVRRLRVPAEQGDVVDDGFRQVAHLDEVVERRRAVALRELRDAAVLVLAHDRREVDEDGDVPAERLVQEDVFRRRGDELRAAHDVRDAHEMVVDDVREVVRRHAVAFEEHLVFELAVRDRDGAVEDVLIRRLAALRHLLADDVRVAVFEVLIDDVLRQVAAGAVIAAELARRVVFLRVAEAIVGVAGPHKLFGIFLVEVHALALDVRAAVAAVARAFVWRDAREFQRALNEVDGVSDIARAVGVLDAQDEVAAVGLGKEIGVKRRAQVADVHVPRRARREARAYFLLCQNKCPPIELKISASSILQIGIEKKSRTRGRCDLRIHLSCRGLPPPLTRPVPPLEGGLLGRRALVSEAVTGSGTGTRRGT